MMLCRTRLPARRARLKAKQKYHPTSRPSWTRNFSESNGHPQTPQWGPQYRVRLLGPAIWSATAISTIYFTCAAYEVYQDAKTYSKPRRQTLTFDQLEADKAPRRMRHMFDPGPSEFTPGAIDVSSPRNFWDSLSGPGQVTASVVGVNALTLGLSYAPSPAASRFVFSLAHTPFLGAFRYHTLLTSAFVHSGPLHMGMNMMVLGNFASSLARTPEFQGSGSHTTAFYLAAGIASALGYHASTNFWPNKLLRFAPVMGFSGVVSAIFAAWCVEHPEGRVRIMFVPYDFTALGMLEGIAAFEVAGALGMLNFLRMRVAHSAHLSGLLFGAAYVTYGKGQKYWTPFRRAAFRSLKSVGVI